MLVIGALFGAAWLWHRAESAIARHELAAARSRITRLTVPSSYARFTDDCRWYRCYLIHGSASSVTPSVQSVFASTGASPVDNGPAQATLPKDTFNGCTTNPNARHAVTNCTLTGSLHHQPVILFLHPYWSDLPGQRLSYLSKTEVDIAFDTQQPACTSFLCLF